jgi:hypothetical protein
MIQTIAKEIANSLSKKKKRIFFFCKFVCWETLLGGPEQEKWSYYWAVLLKGPIERRSVPYSQQYLSETFSPIYPAGMMDDCTD